MSCFIYCRISSSIQQDGVSLDAQWKTCTEVLSSHGLTKPVLIQEVCSASKTIPPMLNTLCNKKKITIVFYSVDRFCRNEENGLEIVDKLLKNNSKLIFVRENLVVSDHGENFSKFQLALKIASAESKAISDRVKICLEHYRSQGFHVGPAPYGKTLVPDKHQPKRKRLDTNSEEDKVIKFIMACSTPGTSVNEINSILETLAPIAKEDPIVVENDDKPVTYITKKFGFSLIAEFLNSYKVPYRNGKEWSANIVSRIVANYIPSSSSSSKDEAKNSMDVEDELEEKVSSKKKTKQRKSSSANSSASSSSLSMSSFARSLRAAVRDEPNNDSSDEEVDEMDFSEDEEQKRPTKLRRKTKKNDF